MSASISVNLVDWSSVGDVSRIEVFRDLLVLYYPHHAKFLKGSLVHTLAPLLALDEPLPSTVAPLRSSLFATSIVPELECAGYYPEMGLKHAPLLRPMHHAGGTPFFLFDGPNLTHFVRMNEFCRMGIDQRGNVCVVFNDRGYVVERRSGSVEDLRTALIARFPKTKAGCGADDFSGMSVWSDTDYFSPGLWQHFGVKTITVVPPLAAVSNTSWSWIGPVDMPKPRKAGMDL